MEDALPDTRYARLLSDLNDPQAKVLPGPSTQDGQEVANHAGVSECLALMHRALERSSATGQP